MLRIVENMGLSWGSQHTKLLNQKSKFHCTDIETVDAQGRNYPMFAMPVEKLPLWLASISPNKIKIEAVRAKVERYQAEAAVHLGCVPPDERGWRKPIALRTIPKRVEMKQAVFHRPKERLPAISNVALI